jgi:hypothetical protein
MEWVNFLKDSELNKSQRPPNGRYLFGKILHDVLECLNSYHSYVELMQKQPGFPPYVLEWFTVRSPIIESLLAQITPLSSYMQQLPETSDQWPILIEKVGQLINSADDSIFELDGFASPSVKFDQDIAKGAIRYLKTLKLLSEDIQAKEYKRLWSILRYKLLPETQA